MKPGPIHLDAQVTWLVCANVCLPGKAHLGLDLMVQPGAPGVAQEPKVGALGQAMTLIPPPLPAGMKYSIRADKTRFELTLVDGKREGNAEFYPFDKTPTDMIVNAAEQNIEKQGDGIRLYVKRSPELAALPASLHGVFKLSDTVAYDVTAPVVPVDDVLAGRPSDGAGGVTAWSAIGLAFLGGIILNLMPCVFPVLFLKGLALVQTAGVGPEVERGHLRRHSLVYTLGILVSFWAIVAVLLVLRATGSHAGWGFQFQSPPFIAMLAAFMFFFALSLAGQFDIGLGLTSVGGALAQKKGLRGKFLYWRPGDRGGYSVHGSAHGCRDWVCAGADGGRNVCGVHGAGVGTGCSVCRALSWCILWARALPGKPGAWMEVLASSLLPCSCSARQGSGWRGSMGSCTALGRA